MDEELNMESQEPPPFGGKPGEPVPTVDPEDVKTVWQIMKDVGCQTSRQKCRRRF
jgi:hypothetical protein